MVDFRASVESESARFAELISSTPSDAPVPSCPGWSMADLAWHLTEVQEFWHKIVEDRRTSPDGMERLDRPGDAELPALFRTESAKLVGSLAACDGQEPCWSWHSGGSTTGWVMRRQAHEALIHRVDAELGADARSEVDPVLAADGVDEVLTVMLDASDLPEWASFERTGQTVAVSLTDQPGSWNLELGRFSGTSPNSGIAYDDPAVRLLGDVAAATTRISGPAAAMDLWLWGRGSSEALEVEGEEVAAEFVRDAARAATQ
ncbi:MAG: maleylpyruvate isomerase family mycothiol-dependent enzyme [Acidimicrobiia bacterium]|nr:maleylpyruvate isomerase family mycothiol-dependent enzyme [Acidimicrobiia bacterium]NNC74957.1 maleylpyruvate isomerase family mycothiol-dependent enzyme [Acidimicrobiia bacterium]